MKYSEEEILAKAHKVLMDLQLQAIRYDAVGSIQKLKNENLE